MVKKKNRIALRVVSVGGGGGGKSSRPKCRWSRQTEKKRHKRGEEQRERRALRKGEKQTALKHRTKSDKLAQAKKTRNKSTKGNCCDQTKRGIRDYAAKKKQKKKTAMNAKTKSTGVGWGKRTNNKKRNEWFEKTFRGEQAHTGHHVLWNEKK